MFLNEARFEMELRQRAPLDDGSFCEQCNVTGTNASVIAGTIRAECEVQLNLSRRSLHAGDNLIDVYDDLDLAELVEVCAEAVGCDPRQIDYDSIDGSLGAIVRALARSRAEM